MTLSTFQIVPILKTALAEDLAQGDVTTDPLIPLIFDKAAETVIRTRQDCVVSGLLVARTLFQLVDGTLRQEECVMDGQFIPAGTVIAKVSGNPFGILKAERTVLNFLQHLCGIATTTRAFVDRIRHTRARITHTRKMTPGLRVLEIQAVLDGGGTPNRVHLGSAAMLKDNHLALCHGQLPEAVGAIRAQLSHCSRLEIECETLEDIEAALAVGADVLLLDNMPLPRLGEAVALVNGRAITEATGGVHLDTVQAIAETGVDYISTSQITLGAPAIDIGLDMTVLRPTPV